MSIFKKVRQLFPRETKIKLIILAIAIIIGAGIETLALSIIYPFISIIMDESSVESIPLVHKIYSLMGFNKKSYFLALLSFLLALIYIFRGIYIYLLNKVQYRFMGRLRVYFSDLLLSKILKRPYLFHANRNIAEMHRVIITDVEQLSTLVINILLFCSDAFMGLFIMGYLFIVSPTMTLFIVGISMISVLLYFKLFRKPIAEAGDLARNQYIEMTKAVNQSLGGIKDVKILRQESYFQDMFKSGSDKYVSAYQRFQVFNTLPKLIIESLCFGIAFIVMGTLLAYGSDMQSMVPQLSVFVLAAFRFLPATSRVVNNLTNILYYHPSVDAVFTNLMGLEDDEFPVVGKQVEAPVKNKNIIVSDVTFRYSNDLEPVLSKASLVIPEKKSVAFIGTSGMGKTTLADIILGILPPLEGAVFYNGQSVHHEFDSWAKNVGYISQQVYLLDETILANVAFGVPKDQIDEQKVWRALEQAQLREFVERQPEGLLTVVGDRGIRLSGGQRQRIGIARALYNDPPILVMDEATSSLDTETEQDVMDAIRGFKGSKTIIIVAHRLSTIQHCDLVYRVEDKKVWQER